MNIKAIVFDLDGVIIESSNIKTEAFKELFAEYPDHLDMIVQYHKENGGISRYEKFEFIYKNIIKKPYNYEIEKKLGGRFQGLVLEKVMTCPFVEGALEFLNEYHHKFPLYIVSGTPETELREILQRKGLRAYFSDVFGSSKAKSEWLNIIIDREQIQAENLLFIGDALSDYRAGVATKTLFIGRVNQEEENIFPEEHTLTTINNLAELSSFIETHNSSRQDERKDSTS